MLQIRKKHSDKGPLWLVEPSYSVGSDATSDIKVSALLEAKHAELHVDGDKVTLINLVKDSNIRVNGVPTRDPKLVSVGDTLLFGNDEYELLDPKSSAKPIAAVRRDTEKGWSLKALNTGLADKQFPITGSHVLGRSKECDICLGVVHLSRQHAKISVTDGGLQVQDLDSSNGTFVNGKKINAALVYAGDELAFDTLRFKVFGPQVHRDEDKTALRPTSADDNMTTVRPALEVPARPAKKPAASARAQKPARPSRPQAQVSPSAGEAPEPDKRSGGSGVMVAVALLLVIAAAGAWFVLK